MATKVRILDLSAGNRAIWFNRNHPDCLYVDVRSEVNPDIICDSRKLPAFIKDDYDLIVFDPPHVQFGKTSDMARAYGHHTTAEIVDIIEKTAPEAHRVSRKDALMAFKWNDHDIPLPTVLKLLRGWEPLFGHLTKDGPGSKTYWCLLRRRDK